MKFVKLFKKEIRELFTVQTLIGAFVAVLMFLLLGNVMNSVMHDITKENTTVVISDQDKSETSAEAILMLADNNIDAVLIDGGTPVEMLKSAKANGHSTVLVIPAGFGTNVLNGKTQDIDIISELTSFAVAADTDNSSSDASELLTEFVTTKTAAKNNLDPQFSLAPVNIVNTTVVGEKSAIADASSLKAFGMQQSIFIPIIVFMLVMFATQINCAAIANEKNDKTLETLLSTPVSRLDVIGSKMCASALYSLIMAVVFIFGFSFYMGNMMGSGMSTSAITDTANMMQTSTLAPLNDSLSTLGIKLSAVHYLMLGVQLFLTISIALTISMILGALAKDIKATQGLITPLMFATMIPYFVTMFTDINALPTLAKTLVYAIPFTHTFSATGNVLFGYTNLFYFGLIYQLIWLVGVVWLAVRIFSSDKIFTMTLEFNKKPKKV